MAKHEPQLPALPPRHHNPQQPQQIAEELSVQLNPLLRSGTCFCLATNNPCGFLARGFLVQRGSFLLGDGAVEAAEEGDEEGQVDCPRDSGAVLEVEG